VRVITIKGFLINKGSIILGVFGVLLALANYRFISYIYTSLIILVFSGLGILIGIIGMKKFDEGFEGVIICLIIFFCGIIILIANYP